MMTNQPGSQYRCLGKFCTLSIINLLQVGLCLVILVMGKLTMLALDELFSVFEDSHGSILRKLTDDVEESDDYVSDDMTAPLLNSYDQCVDVDQYDALMVVHSANWHFQRRQDYRDTYGNSEYTHPYTIKVVFFLGRSTDPEMTSRLYKENSLHGDTVVLSHVESYHNLTYKAVGVFRWMFEKCRKAKVVLKVDDDVLFDVHRFFDEFWPPPKHHQMVMYCHVWWNAQVERFGKWKIAKTEFKMKSFPAYCSGFFVVISPLVIDAIYQTARAVRFIWIDDVFIYGLVRQENAGIQLVHADHMAHKSEIHRKCVNKYSYRCKYWAAVLDEGTPFLGSMLSLRAQRLQLQAEQARWMNRSSWKSHRGYGTTPEEVHEDVADDNALDKAPEKGAGESKKYSSPEKITESSTPGDILVKVSQESAEHFTHSSPPDFAQERIVNEGRIIPFKTVDKTNELASKNKRNRENATPDKSFSDTFQRSLNESHLEKQSQHASTPKEISEPTSTSLGEIQERKSSKSVSTGAGKMHGRKSSEKVSPNPILQKSSSKAPRAETRKPERVFGIEVPPVKEATERPLVNIDDDFLRDYLDVEL